MHASEQLLVQIEQLKRAIALQDLETLNREIDEECLMLEQR
jgi:hypothetical protein